MKEEVGDDGISELAFSLETSFWSGKKSSIWMEYSEWYL